MIIQRKLDNGIRLVMEKNNSVESVSIGIWVKAGSVDENDENSGISHVIEHMMFKGTEKRNAKQIAEDVDRIGGHINAFTGKEATCYYIKTLESNIDKACDILIDLFINSKFDSEELYKEKNVIYEEIKMIEDSPEDDSNDMLFESVFRGSSLERPIIGTFRSLESITRESIIEYIDAEYTTDSIVISAAGSFDEDHLCDIFNKNIRGLKRSKPLKPRNNPLYTPEYRVKVKDVEQSHLCIGLKGVPHEDELFFPMALLNSIMGGTMSSRLFQSIREQKGLAYSVYTASHSYLPDGIFSIYAGVSHNKVEDVIEAIAKELIMLKKEGISDDELLIAKEQLKSSYVFSQENVNSRMYTNGKNILLLSRLMTIHEVLERIDNVTMDDIRRISERIADLDKYSGVLISSRQFDLKKCMEMSEK